MEQQIDWLDIDMVGLKQIQKRIYFSFLQAVLDYGSVSEFRSLEIFEIIEKYHLPSASLRKRQRNLSDGLEICLQKIEHIQKQSTIRELELLLMHPINKINFTKVGEITNLSTPLRDFFHDCSFQKMLVLFLKVGAFGCKFIRCASNCAFFLALMRFNFTGLNLQGIKLDQTNISGANFVRADLSFSIFKSVNICGCDFTESVLNNIDWSDVQSEEIQRKQTSRPITHAAISKNRDYLATVSEDCSIQIWQTVPTILLRTLQSHLCPVSCITFFQNDSMLMSGSKDAKIKIWSFTISQEIAELDVGQSEITAIACHPEHHLFASACSDLKISIWRIEDRSLLQQLSGLTNYVRKIVYSSNGDTLLTASEGLFFVIWDIGTATILKQIKISIATFDVSPRGTLVACGTNEFSVTLISLETFAELETLREHTGQVNSVSFSSDGNQLATGSRDNSVVVWSIRDGQCRKIKRIVGHKANISSALFLRSGEFLVTTSLDCTIRVWSLDVCARVRGREGHSSAVLQVAFSANSKFLASVGSDEKLRLWNVMQGNQFTEIYQQGITIYSVAFSHDGQYMAAGDAEGILTLFDAKEFKILKQLSGHQSYISQITFSLDGKFIVTLSEDQSVRLWDVAKRGYIKQFIGHQYLVSSFQLARKGNRLFTGSWDKSVRIWSVDRGKLLKKLERFNDQVWSISLSPCENFLACGTRSGHLMVLNLRNERQDVKNFASASQFVTSVTFSESGLFLISVTGDGCLMVWSFENCSLLMSFQTAQGYVPSLVFSPNGKYLATCSSDSSVSLYSIALDDGYHQQCSVAEQDIFSLSSDSRFLAIESAQHIILIWDCQNQAEGEKYSGPTCPVTQLCFCKDDGLLAAVSEDQSLWIWDRVQGSGDVMDISSWWIEDVQIFLSSFQNFNREDCLAFIQRYRFNSNHHPLSRNFKLNYQWKSQLEAGLKLNSALAINPKIKSRYFQLDLSSLLIDSKSRTSRCFDP